MWRKGKEKGKVLVRTVSPWHKLESFGKREHN